MNRASDAQRKETGLAKKTKQSDRERDGFLFDEGAGTEQELIDLFNRK